MSASFQGYERIKAKLLSLQAAKPKALEAAGLTLLTLAQKSIQESGPGWTQFAYSTMHRADWRPHALLRKTGTLLTSLSFRSSNNIFEQTDNQIILGSAVKYSSWNNLGTRTIPQREFLKIDDERLQLARNAMLKVITKAWNNG